MSGNSLFRESLINGCKIIDELLIMHVSKSMKSQDCFFHFFHLLTLICITAWTQLFSNGACKKKKQQLPNSIKMPVLNQMHFSVYQVDDQATNKGTDIFSLSLEHMTLPMIS